MNRLVWIPSMELEWSLAEVMEANDDSISVIAATANGNHRSPTSKSPRKIMKFSKNDVWEYDESHNDRIDDFNALKSLHEGPILKILQLRWNRECIYTYASDVLVIVNPYRQIHGLYDDPASYYHMNPLKPHIYALANFALQQLRNSSKTSDNATMNQSIIISGESGAGKTEASKHIVNFLIHVNNDEQLSNQSKRMNSLILNSNLVIESFGNAKSNQNNNSSRFGKYLKLQYNQDHELISSTTESFLLETTRLVSVPNKERNYHIFYQMVRGLATHDLMTAEHLKLSSIDNFRILTRGSCTCIHTADDDIQAFQQLISSMMEVGFKADDLLFIWEILAAILHLGNAAFSCDDHSTCMMTISSSSLEFVSSLLGVDDHSLEAALTAHVISTKNGASFKVKQLDAAEAMNNTNSLMKRLYHKLFTWILATVNDFQQSLTLSQHHPVANFIGILDICGFEIIDTNSFEQLCINYVNERLQHYFNDSVFASEQELYMREGLCWTTVDFHDNKPIIDLLAKKPSGLFHILEEHCMMNRIDDHALLSHYYQIHGDPNNQVYMKPRFDMDSTFIIKHFAGCVTYHIDGFISKNNDALQSDVSSLLDTSTNTFLSRIFSKQPAYMDDNHSINQHNTNRVASTNPPRACHHTIASFQTVSASVRMQIDALMSTLHATESRYVKCIRPNNIKSAVLFDASLAMTQLRNIDIVGIVRIRGMRFPARITYADFLQQYHVLAEGEVSNVSSRVVKKDRKKLTAKEMKDVCGVIAKKCMHDDHYQLGSSMIFMRAQGQQALEDALQKLYYHHAVVIQKYVRRAISRVLYLQYQHHLSSHDLNISTSTLSLSLTSDRDHGQEEDLRVDAELHVDKVEDNESIIVEYATETRRVEAPSHQYEHILSFEEEEQRRAIEAIAIRQRAFQTPVVEVVAAMQPRAKKTWREFILGSKSRPKDKELITEFDSSRIRRQSLPSAKDSVMMDQPMRKRNSAPPTPAPTLTPSLSPIPLLSPLLPLLTPSLLPSILLSSPPSASISTDCFTLTSRSDTLKHDPCIHDDATREHEEARRLQLEQFHLRSRGVIGSPLATMATARKPADRR